MPISLSAKKSLRVTKRNHKTNVALKQKLKTVVKKFVEKPTNDGLKTVISFLDKVGKTNVFHHNKINRLKSRYSKMVEVKTETKAVKATKKTPVKSVKKTVKKATKKMS